MLVGWYTANIARNYLIGSPSAEIYFQLQIEIDFDYQLFFLLLFM